MTPRVRFAIGLLIAIGAFVLLRLLIGNSTVTLFQTHGVIATTERSIIFKTVLVMLSLAVPMLIALFTVVWHFRSDNKKAVYRPTSSAGVLGQTIMWVVPATFVLILWGVTWESTHALDPYRAIVSSKTPITIQVVALPWKWLFIYPAHHIATVNLIEFPNNTPVHFELTADGPMSAFWIPQLGSQIYAMAGMQTQLNLMATEPGAYVGKDTEINGEGYAGMTFTAKSVSDEDFNAWVQQTQQSGDVLDQAAYDAIAKPSSNVPASVYASVQPGLFGTVVMKDMMPTSTTPGQAMPDMDMQGMQMPGM